MTDLRAELEQRLTKFIYKLAIRLASSCSLEFDELVQAGWLAFYETIEKLENNKEDYNIYQMVKYMRLQIHHEMIKVVRTLCHPFYVPLYLNKRVQDTKHTYHRLQGDRVIDKDNEPSAILPDIKERINQVEHLHDLEVLFNKLVCNLDHFNICETDLVIFMMHTGIFGVQRTSVSAIAKLYGISVTQVKEIYEKVLHALTEVAVEGNPALHSDLDLSS